MDPGPPRCGDTPGHGEQCLPIHVNPQRSDRAGCATKKRQPNSSFGWRPDHACYPFWMNPRAHPEPCAPCIVMHGSTSQKKPPAEHEVRLAARPCLICLLRNATSFRTRKPIQLASPVAHPPAFGKKELRSSRNRRFWGCPHRGRQAGRSRLRGAAKRRKVGSDEERGASRTWGMNPNATHTASKLGWPDGQEIKGRSSCCGSQDSRSSMQNLSSSSSTGMGYLPE